MDKKQKRIADQQQLQNDERQDTNFPTELKNPDPDSPIKSGDKDIKTEEEPESIPIDP